MAESRSYTVLGVVGEGGFGKVYRARMAGSGGFTKDVAIKVLHERNPQPELLARFRDEARILGLLRDRAIVSVDPPTRLSGRWAVVMDFVDGQSAAWLLTHLGPFPPGVAVEIIGEVSRALDKAYGFEGPDGQPLQLLHRDVKPANLQITPTGEVRLLDFGVARANFGGREAQTTRSLSGTPGYMAPERLDGVEGPAGDVYSLGVVLWVLLTGEKPSDRRGGDFEEGMLQHAPTDPHRRAALDLARRMRDPDERRRPSHRDVERECRALRQALPEPWLRDWAEQIPTKQVQTDDLAGVQLSETLLDTRMSPGLDPADTGTVSRTLLLGTGLMGFSALGVVALVGLVAVVLTLAVVLWPAPSPVHEPSAAVVVVPDPGPVPILVDTDAGDTDPVDTDAPGTADLDLAGVLPAAPVPVPVPPVRPPAPDPPDPRPAPTPAVTTLPVAFLSQPWGADVFLDGERIGATPLKDVALSVGSHRVELVLGEARLVRTIQVGRRSPTWHRWSVARGEEGWEAGYTAL